eukprot:1361464-Pyramimonas_sp.AAC.1
MAHASDIPKGSYKAALEAAFAKLRGWPCAAPRFPQRGQGHPKCAPSRPKTFTTPSGTLHRRKRALVTTSPSSSMVGWTA